MLNNSLNSKLKGFLDTYGGTTQRNKTIEELAELIRALATGSDKEVIDEIADAYVMIGQMVILYDCKKEVLERVSFKINRQLERLNS